MMSGTLDSRDLTNPERNGGVGERQLRLDGVDHSARPTWKLAETVTFYRDILGLPLVHAITAKGWGPEGHHDFLHFFFDSGRGSTIAFFYYIGSEASARYLPEDHHFFTATHTAWRVETASELQAWKVRLEGLGVDVSPNTRHEILESIYCRDPNGYPVELALRLRELSVLDAHDAEATIKAAIAAEAQEREQGRSLNSIDQVWREKGRQIAELFAENG
jgi:catechol 2,3-dioxygenase-like lactoylglutathione lyase family enzyme